MSDPTGPDSGAAPGEPSPWATPPPPPPPPSEKRSEHDSSDDTRAEPPADEAAESETGTDEAAADEAAAEEVAVDALAEPEPVPVPEPPTPPSPGPTPVPQPPPAPPVPPQPPAPPVPPEPGPVPQMTASSTQHAGAVPPAPPGGGPPPPPPPIGYAAPPPAGYGAPPPPPGAPGAAPPMAPVTPQPGPGDPHALMGAANRLSARSRRSGRVALTVLGAVLDEREVVQVVVQGRYRDEAAVAALSEQRVLIVNERELAPDVISIPVKSSLQVQGWQDDKVAALVLSDGATSETIDRIADRPLALELAQRLRSMVP